MAGKPKPLELDQLRIALSYGALRNALGNYGRLGTDVVLLTPAPTLKGRTLTISGLPPKARRVILFDRGGKELKNEKAPAGGGTLTVKQVPRGLVAWVEVYGPNKTPILFGIPTS